MSGLRFLALWVAFAYGLVANQGGLDNIWKTIQGLPLIVQAIVWLLFLPVTIGLWIWESAWPLLVRLPLVAALAGWKHLDVLPVQGLTPPERTSACQAVRLAQRDVT